MTGTVQAFVEREQKTPVDPLVKGAAALGGRPPVEIVRAGLRIEDLATPLMVVDRGALAHNIGVMAEWCTVQGVELAPHGKTTMAPSLWGRQLTAGAWGITVATEAQLDVAISARTPRIMLANPVMRRAAVERIHEALGHDAGEVLVWVDSVAAVDLLSRPGSDTVIGVLIELGAQGGRAGVRDMATLLRVAARVAETPGVALRGIAGYEGAVADARIDPARSDSYLAAVGDGLEAIRRWIPTDPPVLSVGGSADIARTVRRLRERLTPDSTRVIVRSGAYASHDDGFYRDRAESELPLRAAVSVWGRVISVPEDGLALVDAGRRDLSYDQGLPVVCGVHRDGTRLEVGSPEVTALNDQHAYVRFSSAGESPKFGDFVEFGISHPCTTFDRWPVVLEVEARGDSRAPVVGAFRTYF